MTTVGHSIIIALHLDNKDEDTFMTNDELSLILSQGRERLSEACLKNSRQCIAFEINPITVIQHTRFTLVTKTGLKRSTGTISVFKTIKKRAIW